MAIVTLSSNVLSYSLGGICTALVIIALLSSSGTHIAPDTLQQRPNNSMSQNDDGEPGQDSSNIKPEDWREMDNPIERRKAQNRDAQRRYRTKKRTQAEEKAQIDAQVEAATTAYIATEPEDLKTNDTPSGLPWGSVNIRDVVEKGKAREQQSQASGAGSSPNTGTG